MIEVVKESYALFVDNSGSVGNCQHYWQTVSDILNDYAKDISHYYFWNSRCGLSSKKEFEDSIISKRGTGGTNPTYVAEEIVKERFSNIILVTDGEVGDHEVNNCDTVLNRAFSDKQFKIAKVICYVIGNYI